MSNYGQPGGPDPWPGQTRPDPQRTQPHDQPPGYGPALGPGGYDGSPAGYPPPASGGWGAPPTGAGYGYPAADPRYEGPPAGAGGYGGPPESGVYGTTAGHGSGGPYGPERSPADIWPAPPPRPTKSRTPVVVLLVVLALVVVGGGATTVFLLGRSQKTPAAGAATDPSSLAITREPESAQPTAGSPTPESSADVRFVNVGQCVKNEGGSDKPKLAVTTCAPKTYQVLKRVNGATNGEQDALAKCANVAGYTDWYFFNSELDILDFVLCLKRR